MGTRSKSGDVKSVLQELCKESDFLDLLLDHLSERITDIVNSRCQALQAEVAVLQAVVKESDSHVERLNRRCDDLEQYSRRNNIRIFGVCEEEQENPVAVALEIFNQKMGIKLKETDIDRAHRVGKKSRGAESGAADRNSSSHKRPIIVRFTGYSVRNSVFNSKSKLKGTKITIREDLTKRRLDQYVAASTQYGFKNVWSKDGNIFYRHEEVVHKVN